MGARRFETLDGMRGLCALIVAVFHFGVFPDVGTPVRLGWLCVDMFFVLSGFVVAMTYEERLRGGLAFKAFLAARARRLLPIQILGTVIAWVAAAALHWHGPPDPWLMPLSLIACLLLIQITWTPFQALFSNWVSDFPANPAMWSLQGEWLINLFYGRHLHRWSTRAVCWFAAAFVLFMIFLATTRFGNMTFATGIGRAGLGFALGILIHRAREKKTFQRLPAIHPLIIFAIWLGIICIPADEKYKHLLPLAASITSGLCVALLIRGERPMGWIWAYLGRLSYPLYASHYAIINLALLFWWTPIRTNQIYAIPMLGCALLLAAGLDFVVSVTWWRQPQLVPTTT